MTVTGIFLHIVHFFVTLQTLVYSLFSKFTKPWPLKWGDDGLSHTGNGKSFSKIPIHLGLVIVEEDISYTDLAKIAAWCIIIGISHISFYDRKGICKRNKELLHEKLEKYRNDSATSPLLANRSIEVRTGISKPQTQAPSEGHTHIRLLSLEDGRQHIVETARELSHAVHTQCMKLSDIEPATVDTILQDKCGFPDPDLIIRFGDTESLLGYLPWQIRLTEILSLPSHRHLTYQSFHNVLLTYGNTKQRFGK